MGAGSEAPKGRQRQGSDYQLGELDLGLGPSAPPVANQQAPEAGPAADGLSVPQLGPEPEAKAPAVRPANMSLPDLGGPQSPAGQGAPGGMAIPNLGGSAPNPPAGAAPAGGMSVPNLGGAGNAAPPAEPAGQGMAIPNLGGSAAPASQSMSVPSLGNAPSIPNMSAPSAQPAPPAPGSLAAPPTAPPGTTPTGSRIAPPKVPRLTMSGDDGTGATKFELDHAHAKGEEDENSWAGQVNFGATVDSFDDLLNPDQNREALELQDVNARAARITKPKTSAEEEQAELELRRTQAEQIAQFGEVPEKLQDTVLYTGRVLVRMVTLYRLREKARKEAENLQKDLREAMAELGAGLMDQAKDPAMAPLGKPISAVHNARAKASHAGRSVEQQRDKADEALHKLATDIKGAEKELEPYTNAESEAAKRHQKALEEVKRAEAMEKRVEIELRALHEASAVQDPSRIAELEKEFDKKAAVVDKLKQTAEGTAQALGEARAELAAQRGTLDSLEERKKHIIDEAKRTEAALEEVARDAEDVHKDALVSLALEARDLGLDRRCRELAEWADDVSGTTAEAKHNALLHDLAFESYDKPSLIKGGSVMFGLVLALVMALILAPSLAVEEAPGNAEPPAAGAAPAAPGH